MVKLTIDNKPVEVAEGTTILKAARQAGINIPTLCYFELDLKSTVSLSISVSISIESLPIFDKNISKLILL